MHSQCLLTVIIYINIEGNGSLTSVAQFTDRKTCAYLSRMTNDLSPYKIASQHLQYHLVYDEASRYLLKGIAPTDKFAFAMLV